MQLSPLQSRLAASLIASCLLIVVYLFFFFPQFATAIQLDDTTTLDTNDDDGSWVYDRLEDDADSSLETKDSRGPEYESEFALFDRSIIGRAPAGVTALTNNEPRASNIQPGETITYVFELASIQNTDTSDPSRLRELRGFNGSQTVPEDGAQASGDSELARRQEPTKTLWISVNTCQQPSRISPDQTTMDPPQLSLFVSKSSNNISPGPDQDEDIVEFIPFDEGAAMFNTTLTEDVFFSIHAPDVSSEFFNTALPYNFEVATSVDQSYHTVADNANSELVWVDSDARGALLTTRNLTSTPEEVIETPPYLLFANNKNDTRINGLRHSYCGLRKEAQIRMPENGQGGQITIGLKHGGQGNLTKQEFYIGGLNQSSQYVSILVRDPIANTEDKKRNAPGGGGIVFRETELSTKPDGACRVIFNLTLCDETQYAVPANAVLFPEVTDLEAFYDNYTRTMYSNFERSLQQIQCEAPSENRYSLVKTCEDCKTAYKDWLCSVAIPRCEDFSSPNRPFLQSRNIDKKFPNGTSVDQGILDKYGDNSAWTSSRNPLIDEMIQPGPYKEVLPCDDVCYQLVQSCPAALGFNCPLPGSIGFNVTYGKRTGDGLTCNYPGSAHYPSASGRHSIPWLLLAGAIWAVLSLGL